MDQENVATAGLDFSKDRSVDPSARGARRRAVQHQRLFTGVSAVGVLVRARRVRAAARGACWSAAKRIVRR